MSKESIGLEPILDEEIIEQNFELMEEKFPEMLLEEWRENIVPIIQEIILNYKNMNDIELAQKSHKCAGSALQLGANRLGQALRTSSHLTKSGNREQANSIFEDIKLYFDEFEIEVSKTK